jgi:hypothetical protein
MKSNNVQSVLPFVSTAGLNVSDSFDVSSGFQGFCVQTKGVAAGSTTYELEGSLDGGTTWDNITGCLLDLTNAGAAIGAAVITADSIFAFARVFPGLIRLRCTVTGTGTPMAYIGVQDSRQQ